MIGQSLTLGEPKNLHGSTISIRVLPAMAANIEESVKTVRVLVSFFLSTGSE